MIDHALYCSKTVTNDSHHLPNVHHQFLCIKKLTLKRVYEINSKWFEALQLACAAGLYCLKLVLAKILIRGKTFIDLVSFRPFLQEDH